MKYFSIKNNKFSVIIYMLSISLLLAGVINFYKYNKYKHINNHIMEQVNLPIVPLPATVSNIKVWNYRIVTLGGQFLHKEEKLVNAIDKDGNSNGYYVITPLQRISGIKVFVNRGWIPSNKLNSIVRPNGVIKITGYIIDKDIFPRLANRYVDKDFFNVKSKIKKSSVFPMILYSINNNYKYPKETELLFYNADKNMSYGIMFVGLAIIILISNFYTRKRDL